MKKINITQQLFIPFLLAVMIYFFIPSEIYFTNIQEMTSSYSTLLKGFIPNLLLLYFGLLIITFLLLYLNDKLYRIFIAVITSVIFIFFINNFFFQVQVVLDGTEKINIFSMNSIINIIVNTAVLILTFFIIIKKNNIKALYPLLYIILVVQIGIYMYGYINNHNEIIKISENNKLEQKNIDKYNILQLSKEQNIIYIVLDAFDHEILAEIIKDNKLDVANDFKDFIYFSNYTSLYPQTKSSGIAQFTDKIYQNEMPFKEFQEKAFSSGKSTFEQLKKQGWDNIIYPSNTIYAPNIELYSNVSDGSNDMRQLNSLEDITYYKIVPLMFKNLIRGLQQYSKDNWDFTFLNILNNKVNGNDNKTFLLIHLIGAHPPYVVNENLEMSTESSRQKQAVASLKLMKKFIDKLKKEGFYDNSLIVITADHGAIALRSHPILFIKPYNAENNKLITDNKSLSQHSMNKILLNYAADKTYNINLLPDEENRVFYSYSNTQLGDARYLPPMTEYVVPENAADYDKYVLSSIMNTEPIGTLPVKYSLQDNISNLPKGMFDKTWEKTSDGLLGKNAINIKVKERNGIIFKSEIKNPNPAPVLMTVFEKNKLLYKTSINGNSTKKIETTLLLDEIVQVAFDNKVIIKNIEIEQAEKYSNLNNISGNKVVISDNLYDNKSGMVVKLNADITFKDKVATINRNIIIKYNNIILSRYTVYNKNSNYYVIIPANIIKRNGIIEISADDKLLEQINIKSASIISGKGYEDIFKMLQEPNRFISSDELPEMTYMQGWQNTEADRRWGRKDNYVYLPIPQSSSANMLLNIYGHAFINLSKKQDVSFYSNDKLLYKTDVSERREKKFTIKLNENDVENGFILLHIKTNYTDTASNNKLGNDTRVLGFALTGIEFKTIDNTADINDYVDYSIRDISLMGIDGLYSPEKNLIWTDKNFIIKIPYEDIPKHTENIVVEIDGRFYFNKEKDAQNIEVYYNNSLVKKFTAQDDNVKSYSIMLDTKNISKDLELVFKAKYACSPADNGENSDKRKLSFAVSGLKIYKPVVFNTGEYLVKDIDNNTFKSNWYSKEPTLIWSSNNAELTLPLSKELQEQASIFIDIKGMAYFNKSNDMQTLGIYADDTLLKEFEVINNDYNTYTVEVPKKYLKDVLNLTFRTKYNSSPKLDGRGDDSRLLGFALTGINIKKENIVNEVQKTVKEEKVSYSQIFNTREYLVKDIDNNTFKSNWYSKEPTLIWSSNNAELTLPLSKELQEQASIFIDIKGMAYFNKSNDMQTLGIYADDTLLKEFEVINNDYNTYTVEVPKKYLKDVLNLTFRTKYNSSPKLDGRGDDSRLLGFALTGINIKKENIVNEVQKTVKEEKVSYSQIFNTREYLVKDIDNNTFKSNWYSKEPTLIWSSNNAELTLPLSKELQEQASIFIDIKGMAYFNKSNDMQTLGIYADDTLLKEFEVINNDYNTYTVEVPKKYLKDVLNLTIRTKYNSSPKLDGRGDDSRLLGFALTGINIRNNDNNINAVQNEIKYGIKEISMMNGKGWYQPEPELIWARKNAELLIPVSNINNTASISIILKGQMFISNAKEQSLSIYCKDKKINEYKVNDNNIYDYSFTVDVDKNMEYIPLKLEAGYEEQPKIQAKV